MDAENVGVQDVALAAFVGTKVGVSGRFAGVTAANAARLRAANEAAFRLDTFHTVVALQELCYIGIRLNQKLGGRNTATRSLVL